MAIGMRCRGPPLTPSPGGLNRTIYGTPLPSYELTRFCWHGAYPIGIGTLYTSRNASLSLAGRRVTLLCAPFQIEMFVCGIVSPRVSIVARHRGENTTDEVRPVARAPARHGIVRDVANAARSLHACRARIVGAHLRRAIVPTHRSMLPCHRGSEATVGAEGRRRTGAVQA